jgi:hypothetical protein
MILKKISIFQTHSYNYNRYQCVLISSLHMRSVSIQVLLHYYYAYAPYLYEIRCTYYISYSKRIKRRLTIFRTYNDSNILRFVA